MLQLSFCEECVELLIERVPMRKRIYDTLLLLDLLLPFQPVGTSGSYIHFQVLITTTAN